MLQKRNFSFVISALIFLLFSFSKAAADTLYLKNGRSLAGIIKREDADIVELEVGFGTITFEKNQIKEIRRSTPQEAKAIEEDWEKKKIELEHAPRSVEFSRDKGSIVLGAILNESVDSLLVLDTGASVIVLRKNLAPKLGIDLTRVRPDASLQLADGRQVRAKRIILKSVRIEGAEANNVEAAIMLDEAQDFQFSDGLLGMSFLKRFNFKVDQKERKLILEKY